MDQLELFAIPMPGEYLLPEGHYTTCASCGAAIAWTRTVTDKSIPLSLSTVRTIDGQRYAMNHFTDCPQGQAWRKQGGGK
jgi:hypothetical protein